MTSIGQRVVDLRKKFSAGLLQKFYYDLLVPAFKARHIDQLEDFQVFYDGLQANLTNHPYLLHVILVLNQYNDVVAGASCEFYPKSRCGIMNYLVVTEPFRKKGLAHEMVDYVVNTLNKDSTQNSSRPKSSQGIAGFFIACKSDTAKQMQDSMDPKLRHQIMTKLGFGILEFEYIQQAYEEEREKRSDLVLTAHKRFSSEGSVDKYVVINWLKEFYEVLVDNAKDHPDLQKMIANMPDRINMRFAQ